MAEGKKRKKDLSKSASDLILQTSGFTSSDMGKQDPAKVERIKKLQADNKLYLLSSPIEDLSPSDKRQRRKFLEEYSKLEPIKKAKGGLFKKPKKKPKKKCIDGIARKGKTKGKNR